MDTINTINEKIVQLKTRFEEKDREKVKTKSTDGLSGMPAIDNLSAKPHEEAVTHKGKVMFDATACPQDIAYPTDLNLLSDARRKAEELIDSIYNKELHGEKPRTYRREARKYYLQTAQKKNKTKKEIRYVEHFRRRFGYYPREVLADKIYCTRVNRTWLKEKDILLRAKPLGRPSAVSIHVSPGERNPIEGKFGQGKTAYGLNRIKARLMKTSESWIAGIFLVLNLVKLAGVALPCLILTKMQNLTAQCQRMILITSKEHRTLFSYRKH